MLLLNLAFGDVSLGGGRLTFDGLLQADARWRQRSESGLTTRSADFYRFGAPVGVTGSIGEAARLRISLDAGLYQRSLDLYADVLCNRSFTLRAGQFLAPTGFEALTDPKHLKFVEYSFVRAQWKPYDPRDVGVMATYDGAVLGLALALVNGNGRNDWLQDENNWKDVSARAVLRSFSAAGVLLAGRCYYGRTGAEGVQFFNSAVEAKLSRNRLDASSECQFAIQGDDVRGGAYVQAAYRMLDYFEVAARVHGVLAQSRDWSAGATGGINFPIVGDDLKVMLDYDFRRVAVPRLYLKTDEHLLLLQLQAAF